MTKIFTKDSQIIKSRNPLALDMGWKSGKLETVERALLVSQSACAGYGLEESFLTTKTFAQVRLQSAFAGYGLERLYYMTPEAVLHGRNPLALDMGWKSVPRGSTKWYAQQSQSVFAGYGLEEPH